MNARNLLPATALFLECSIDLIAIGIGVADSEARVLIGGAVVRLAAVVILARLAWRGRNWARLVLVGIEAITSLLALFFVGIVFKNADPPRLPGLIIVA